MTLRVLSLDGGGVRGILSGRVLVELEAITGRPISELFDLIAGTATGGVLALGLAAPGTGGCPRFSAAELQALFLQRGHELFPQPDPTHRLRHSLGFGRNEHPAAQPLADRFGETPLGDATVDVIVPTFDMVGAEPMLLRSGEFGPGLGPPMRQVALATSSVPTHYPAVTIELGARTWELSHGGLVANNPAPLAYVAALATAEPSEVVFVSVGTGARSRERRNGAATRPASRWPYGVTRAFEQQLEASSEAQHQLLDALMAAVGSRERYWRLQPLLEPHPNDQGLADPLVLSHFANTFVEGVRPTLNEIADQVAV